MPLATVDDVAARLGRPIPEEEKPRVAAFLDDVSAFVEDYCGRDFEQHQDETFSLAPAADAQLDIPPRYLPNLTITTARFDQGEALTDWRLRGRALWRPGGWDEGQAVNVTGSWGYPAPPAAIKAVVCAEVIRWLAVSPGVVSEKVGDLEIEFGASSAAQSLSPTAMASLRRYRRRVGSLTLRRTR
ncbi:phage gp6-like head-tail connector protein [Streptomyces sp. NPDC058861]|uniref:phage gp6-like head-tail connector protein n=1 Tax=Streptomyces sp. NPDC058861 TaxID=3346653 RepID=UPI0036BBEA61